MSGEELQQLKTWIRQLKFKSIDKDNMEYEVRMTCYVKDLLERFANEPD